MTTLPAPLPLHGSPSMTGEAVLPDIRIPSRKLRRAFHLIATVLCAGSAAALAFHGYVAWMLTHPPVVALGSNPLAAKNLPYESVTFPSDDGRTLVDGWWIPAAAASGQTIVLSHGYGANREELWVPMYDLAEHLHMLQYNVLMFDYGFANPDRYVPASGGLSEARQLIGAVRFARSMGTDRLVVWGFSMGAGTALQAALDTDERIDGMILDSTFLPTADTIYHNIRNYAQLPKYPSVTLIQWFMPMMSGTRLEQLPTTRAQHTDYGIPMLLIHGSADDKSPLYLSENVAQAQTHPQTRLWVVPGAIHEMSYRTHTDEYVARTTSFLSELRSAWI